MPDAAKPVSVAQSESLEGVSRVESDGVARLNPLSDPQRIERAKILYQLWMTDGNILVVKSGQFVTVNALLVAAFSAFANAKDPAIQRAIAVFGVLLAVFWAISSLRTQHHRVHWRQLIENDPLNVMPSSADIPWYASLSSSTIAWILPFLGFVSWGATLIVMWFSVA